MSFNWYFLKRVFKPKKTQPVAEETYDETLDEVGQELEGDAYAAHVQAIRDEASSEPVEEQEETKVITTTTVTTITTTEPLVEQEEAVKEPVLASEPAKKQYSWNEFRSAHKGMTSSEISSLWAEYKEGTYEVRTGE